GRVGLADPELEVALQRRVMPGHPLVQDRLPGADGHRQYRGAGVECDPGRAVTHLEGLAGHRAGAFREHQQRVTFLQRSHAVRDQLFGRVMRDIAGPARGPARARGRRRAGGPTGRARKQRGGGRRTGRRTHGRGGGGGGGRGGRGGGGGRRGGRRGGGGGGPPPPINPRGGAVAGTRAVRS